MTGLGPGARDRTQLGLLVGLEAASAPSLAARNAGSSRPALRRASLRKSVSGRLRSRVCNSPRPARAARAGARLATSHHHRPPRPAASPRPESGSAGSPGPGSARAEDRAALAWVGARLPTPSRWRRRARLPVARGATPLAGVCVRRASRPRAQVPGRSGVRPPRPEADSSGAPSRFPGPGRRRRGPPDPPSAPPLCRPPFQAPPP